MHTIYTVGLPIATAFFLPNEQLWSMYSSNKDIIPTSLEKERIVLILLIDSSAALLMRATFCWYFLSKSLIKCHPKSWKVINWTLFMVNTSGRVYIYESQCWNWITTADSDGLLTQIAIWDVAVRLSIEKNPPCLITFTSLEAKWHNTCMATKLCHNLLTSGMCLFRFQQVSVLCTLFLLLSFLVMFIFFFM